MSIETGLSDLVDAALREIQPALAQSAAALQVDFLDEPMTSEEVLIARDQLGDNAGALSIGQQVRANRRGRPKGARNRNTSDLVSYLRQFGPDPAVVMMKIMSQSEEAMVERSKLIDPPKKQMSFGEAQAVRIRCAETIIDRFYGKKPIEIKLDTQGDFNLLIPGVNISESDATKMAEGTFILDGVFEDIDQDIKND